MPTRAEARQARRFADLAQRTIFAIIFAAIGIGAIWAGGVFGLVFVMAAGAIMAWEWRRIHLSPDFSVVAAFQAAAVAGSTLTMFLSGFPAAVTVLAGVSALGVAVDLARRRSPWWSLGGALYIGLSLIFFVMLMIEPTQGLETIVWLVLIVVATDVGAYFAGRLFGGPKLWRRVSPGKTWSGALGGVAFAALIASVIGWQAGRGFVAGAVVAAVVISAVSQAGDLVESAYKRRFGKKDAGVILPGHGGLLDRLDGMVAATLAIGALSLLRPAVPVWEW